MVSGLALLLAFGFLISGDPALPLPVSDDGGVPPNVTGGERTSQFTPGHLWPTDDQSGLPQPTDRRKDVIPTPAPCQHCPDIQHGRPLPPRPPDDDVCPLRPLDGLLGGGGRDRELKLRSDDISLTPATDTPGHLWPTDDQPELRQLTGENTQTLPVRRSGVAPVYSYELRQLTDSAGVREERDRGQSLCSALQVTHDAINSNGNKLSRKDLDQVPLMFLVLASFRTFDGGGISLVEEIMTYVMCTVQLGLCLS